MNPNRPKFLSALLLLACFLLPYALWGQAAPAPTVAAPPQNITFWVIWKQGGWCMYPLLIFSIAGVGLMVYNGIMIRPQLFLRKEIIQQVRTALEALDLEKAKELCRNFPSPTTNIILAGLERMQDGHVDMDIVNKSLDETTGAEMAAPFVFISYLNTIGALSPMVGLLGTVFGMVKAFSNIGSVGMGDPSLLANNIAEALVTTAAGLIVAIPCLIAYFYFKNQFAKIGSQVGKIVDDTFFAFQMAARKAG